ncbi:hypothetical protein, variant 2 [Aphanomyces invadans]|uniref:Uncharacterized protein n=1 Tax=Aphanomyces invadans TaxID=157072 RepID=A0A024TUK2_9STRA|nr:hypothetical protein H310_09848 [Aphanomyces invadans]XP_008874250.1 hypothetical protein, variant 1 [Aphanomyces invadans]XP_008874251.1 hypothetical protein, variant 2 [Aphanomyces invadans]ETV97002.1 hypothetical protein H310_09848 [Aphanomyces invadans]ETV97003.1 hypothetical protein, variant 1 [Aphanomyces invadans]ETV97004.1 hypothetical protein, variant 2 [Aphanomyces invadans]|eukprot:XP_008874248.1 hypothetical protein H310_09848 [Aphanomyces invadans]
MAQSIMRLEVSRWRCRNRSGRGHATRRSRWQLLRGLGELILSSRVSLLRNFGKRRGTTRLGHFPRGTCGSLLYNRSFSPSKVCCGGQRKVAYSDGMSAQLEYLQLHDTYVAREKCPCQVSLTHVPRENVSTPKAHCPRNGLSLPQGRTLWSALS